MAEDIPLVLCEDPAKSERTLPFPPQPWSVLVTILPPHEIQVTNTETSPEHPSVSPPTPSGEHVTVNHSLAYGLYL